MIHAYLASQYRRSRAARLTMARSPKMTLNRSKAVGRVAALAAVGVVVLLSSLAMRGFAQGGGHLVPPPIAGGIGCDNVRTCGEANRAFTQRLNRRFPPGTSVASLRSELTTEGFQPLPAAIKDCLPPGEPAPIGKLVIECPAWNLAWDPRNELVYGWGVLPCGRSLSVRWDADRQGRVTRIEGYYDYTCP